MKETIVRCDGCKTTSEVVQYKLDMGTEADSSGNGHNTNWEYKDFCFDCLRELVADGKIDITKMRLA